MRMALQSADRIAAKVVAELRPYCDLIEVAGSIRRQRSDVGDIDIVVQTKPGQTEAMKARCRVKCRVVKDGPQTFIVMLPLPKPASAADAHFWVPEVQIDLWIASPPTHDLLDTRPGNFGSLLLFRTGSKEWNIRLLEAAKRRGLAWNPYLGVIDGDGRLIAHRSEQEICEAIGVQWLPPELRDR